MQHIIPNMGILTGVANKLSLLHAHGVSKPRSQNTTRSYAGTNGYEWVSPCCAAFAFSQGTKASTVECIPAPNESIFIATSTA